MPLLGKDMMITGKIIEKAEEEEEDSDEQQRYTEEDAENEDDYDFEQYKNIDDDYMEIKKIHPSPHLTSSLREKALKKREI